MSGSDCQAAVSGNSAIGLPLDCSDQFSMELYCDELVDCLRQEAWSFGGASNWPHCKPGHTHPMDFTFADFNWRCPDDSQFTRAIA